MTKEAEKRFVDVEMARLQGTVKECPEAILYKAAKILVDETLSWLHSETGKAEVERIRINRLHREEHAKKKGRN